MKTARCLYCGTTSFGLLWRHSIHIIRMVEGPDIKEVNLGNVAYQVGFNGNITKSRY